MGDHQSLIQLEDIHFSYANQKSLIKGLNFELFEKQKIGLIGDNGSGKTTILHILTGIIQINSGIIRFKNQIIKTEKDFRNVRQEVGILFQNSDDQLFCPTVLEDVAFGPLNLGLTPEKARIRALETLEYLNLQDYEDRIIHQLSGGEKKLVALATILAMKPKVLLLDEPTAGLDESTRNRISSIFKNLDLSYIIVSHEFDFLSVNTDMIYGMKNGIINFHGKSNALHSHLHSHPVGEVRHKHTQTLVD